MITPTYDLIVIGGGIVGVSAAFEAVQHGARVAVVDGALPGRATDAGAGIVSPVGLDRSDGPPELIGLITECVASYRVLSAEIDALVPVGAGPTTFRQVGELVVARAEPDELDRLEMIRQRLATPADQAAHGLTGPPETVAGPDLGRWWPELRTDVSALYIADVARVAGARFSERLSAATDVLADSGQATIERHHGVGRVEDDGAGVRVRLGDTTLSGGAALLATGSWAGEELARFGVQVGVEPVRGQIVHLRIDQPTGAAGSAGYGDRPVVNTLAGHYLLGFDDRILVGATHERVGFDARVTAAGQGAVITDALQLAPGLAEATVLQTKVGLRPASSDGLPLVGRLADHLHVATGLGSWGLTLGPLLGRAAARLALGEELPLRYAFLDPTRRLQPDTVC